MARNVLAFAAVCLALPTACAAGDYMTYEGRGYGGPLGVGPNFNSSKPSAPKHYRKRTYKKRATTRPSNNNTETAKSAPEADVPVKKSVKKDTVNQNSSIATSAGAPAKTAVHETGATPAAEPQSATVGCKRFIPSIGETVTVPCE